MKSRHICRGLVVGVLVTMLTGCEPLHSLVRGKDSTDRKDVKDDSSTPGSVDSDGSKILDNDSDGKNSQPFFKNNRPSGGWSSEAREIERSLGVGS
jgi:hypothetical protein